MERNNRKKILVVENSIGITGAFKAILQTVEDLNNDFEFIFVIPKNSLTKTILEDRKITTYDIKFAYLSKKISAILTYLPILFLNVFQLYKIVKKEKVKIIHSNDLYNLTPVLLKFVYKKFYLITHIRMLPGSFPKSIFSVWKSLNLLMADKIIGVSEAALKTFPKNKKCKVIYDRVPKKETLPYEYKTKDINGDVSIIYISNYIPDKGQDLAILAFKKAKEKYPKIKLTFMGSDLNIQKNKAFKTELKNLAISCKCESDIIFKDFSLTIEEEIKNHQILLNLSKVESFSFTVLEALYYGVPCIASTSGGPQEILENGKYGILVDNKDSSTTSNAIIQLATDIELRKRLSFEGRDYVRERFSINNTSKKLSVIYNSFLL